MKRTGKWCHFIIFVVPSNTSSSFSEREEQHLKARDATSSSSNVWERVTKEFDVSNAKAAFPTKDVSRMKGIMLDLRKDSNAPGTIVA